MQTILATTITAVCGLIGIVYTARMNHNKTVLTLEKQLAVISEQIKELTREVREHNDFAHRVPVLEQKIKSVSQRIDTLERRP